MSFKIIFLQILLIYFLTSPDITLSKIIKIQSFELSKKHLNNIYPCVVRKYKISIMKSLNCLGPGLKLWEADEVNELHLWHSKITIWWFFGGNLQPYCTTSIQTTHSDACFTLNKTFLLSSCASCPLFNTWPLLCPHSFISTFLSPGSDW